MPMFVEGVVRVEVLRGDNRPMSRVRDADRLALGTGRRQAALR